MRQTAELCDRQQLSVSSLSTMVIPDTRHFIPTAGREQQQSWYQHWPEFHCGHQLHASETVTCCQNNLMRSSPAILLYDALFPGARGATPLLQSLLNHCPDYSEAWGINSGYFSPETASAMAAHFIRPGYSLVYVHDPLRRLSPSAERQEVTINILTYQFRDSL